MEKKIKIVECIGQLGLGGTEYALQLYCKYFDKDIFDVSVISLYSGGERVAQISEMGISVSVLNGNFNELPELIKSADVVHWHGSGLIDENLFQVLTLHRPELTIQTNVFGLYSKNNHLYDIIDFDIYISKMILVRRMELDQKCENKYESKRKFLSYPVDIDYLISQAPTVSEVKEFKARFNLENITLIGRIGRASDHKFDLITLDGFKAYLKFNSSAKFVIIGATEKILSYCKFIGIYDHILNLPNTIDLKTLLIYYKSLDVFLAASSIGESFGMVIAESMSMGTPVLTISTPNKDNAQIELVDNNLTGLVVPRLKRKIGLALNNMCSDREFLNQLSRRSVDKVYKEFEARKIVGSLENLILSHFKRPAKQVDNLLYDWSASMKKEYQDRLNNLFGSLSLYDRLMLSYNRTIINKVIRKLLSKLVALVYPKTIK